MSGKSKGQGLAYAGLAAVFVLFLASERYQVVDERRWIVLAAAVSTAIAALLCLSPDARAFLLRSEQKGLPPNAPAALKHALRGLGWLVMLGALSFSCAAALALANGALDSAPPSCRAATAVRVSSGGGTRGRGAQVHVRSWREGREEETLLVPFRFAAEVRAGTVLDVCTRPGALGVEWLASYGVAQAKR